MVEWSSVLIFPTVWSLPGVISMGLGVSSPPFPVNAVLLNLGVILIELGVSSLPVELEVVLPKPGDNLINLGVS